MLVTVASELQMVIVMSALRIGANIMQTGQSTVIHVMNGKEENNESKVSGRV